MCADDLDLMPTVGDGAYSDEEVHWCKETIRYSEVLAKPTR